MYVCMYVCMYGWMDGWTDGRTDGRMYRCMYACMYASMYALCMHVSYACMYPCIHVSMYLCIYASAYVYVCLDAYIYIYIYIHGVPHTFAGFSQSLCFFFFRGGQALTKQLFEIIGRGLHIGVHGVHGFAVPCEPNRYGETGRCSSQGAELAW